MLARIQRIHMDSQYLDENNRLDNTKLDLVGGMGANWYTRANNEALFEIPKPLRTQGIGVDQLPTHVRESELLTANNLGRLGNIERFPNLDQIKEVKLFTTVAAAFTQFEKDELKDELHRLAKIELQLGNTEKALTIYARMMLKLNDILWSPTPDFIKQSGLKKYQQWLGQEFGLSLRIMRNFGSGQIPHFEDFWESLWAYFKIISYSEYDSVVNSYDMPGARWFNGATLNYSEHIFRQKTTERPALLFANEAGVKQEISWQELESQVASIQAFLRSKGIKKGDRVAGYVPILQKPLPVF